jgi:ribosomal protein S4E
MKAKQSGELRDGAKCRVIAGTHAGKSGAVRDIKTGKTGHVSITVEQANGERLKTLAKNVVLRSETPD